MEGERQLRIETGLTIERPLTIPIITRESDFDSAYKKGLDQNGIGLYDETTAITQKDNKFLIGTTNGKKMRVCIEIESLQLLEKFVRYTTDKYYRELFSDVSNNFNVYVTKENISKEIGPGITSNQEILRVTVKEELNQLKEDISFQQIIDSCKVLTTGGEFTNTNGEKKSYKSGQYEELKNLISASKPKKDDIIYKQNLKLFTQIIDEQKENIQKIQSQAESIQNNKYGQNHSTILKRRKQELGYVHAQYSQIERYLTDPTLMNKPFDGNLYNTDLAIYSSKDIKILQKKIGTQDKEMRNINEGMFNTALLQLDFEDRQDFKAYLNEVIGGTKDPSKSKYQAKNKESFDEIVSKYPDLQGYIDFFVDKNAYKPEVQDNLNGEGKNTIKQDSLPGMTKEEQEKRQKELKTNPKYADWNAALAQGGINGLGGYLLDKTHMSPEQKQFRGGMGNLAVTAGAIFVGRKMISSAFNLITGAYKGKENTEKRRKAWAWLYGPLAVMFGLNAATGDGISGILKGGPSSEFLANPFGFFGKKDKNSKESEKTTTTQEDKESQRLREKYGEQPTHMLTIFDKNTKYGDIRKMVEKSSDGKMRLKEETYSVFMKKFRGEFSPLDKNTEGENFLRTIGAEDPNGIIDLSLTSMGITRDKLQDDREAQTTIGEIYARLVVKLSSIPQFMEEKRYTRIDPSKMDKIEAYLSDPDATIDDLEKLANEGVFVKGEIKDKTGLNTRIEEIAQGDKELQESLIIGLNSFYDYMPNGPKEIKLIGNGPEIEFVTYGESTKINIEKKTIIGFDSTRFDDLFELFKVANLTNRIRYICKDKEGLDKKPFYVDQLGNIKFNQAKIFSKEFDTTVLSAGFRGSLDNISPTLANNKVLKEAYKDYLNTMDWKVKQVEIEPERLDNLPQNVVDDINRIVGTHAQKAEILLGLKRFYTDRPNGPRDLKVTGNRPKIQFRTYGQQIVTVDLEGKYLDGCGAKFTDYEDLFKAANLTNYIRMLTFDKAPRSDDGDPFKLNGMNDITFNDGLLFDTKIMGTGRFSSLKEVSPTLNTYRDAYVSYLNKLRDKTGLRNKVRKFVEGNDQREADITAALNLFYEYMPNNERKVDIYGTRPKLAFITYGQFTPIDMSSKGIVGFSACHFDSYLEAFKAANLTNAIKHTFKDRKAGDFPFNISMFGGDIEFDRNVTFEKGFPRLKGVRDVEAISAGRRGSLGEISPKLEEFKSEYVEYLNSLKFRKRDPNLSDFFFEPNPNKPH